LRNRIFPLAVISMFVLVCFIAMQTPRLSQTALASVSQELQGRVRNEVSDTCSVTKPPAQPFVPPLPYWTDHGPHGFWYGTESLWTLLPVHGASHIHNNVDESKGGYRTKLTYWRRGFDWRREPNPELIVIAKRLDREAPPVAAPLASAVFVNTDEPAMMTGIDIPTIGCWKITAQYRGHNLSFVVSVQP
jgi:hypothetical protein